MNKCSPTTDPCGTPSYLKISFESLLESNRHCRKVFRLS